MAARDPTQGWQPRELDPAGAKVLPLRKASAALSNASTAMQQLRPVDLDIAGLRASIDVVIADLIEVQQATLTKALAVLASILAGR